VVEIQTFGSIVNVRMHEVGTLLVTIYLNFPSIVRHTVPRWLSSRHFNTHGLSGGGKRGREVVGKPDKSFQRTHRRPTAARKCESKRRKKKRRKYVVQSAQHRQQGERTDRTEYSHRQSFSHSFWLLLSRLFVRSPWKSRTYLLPQTPFRVFLLLCFSPRWLEYIDVQPGERLLFAASAISCFHPAYSFTIVLV